MTNDKENLIVNDEQNVLEKKLTNSEMSHAKLPKMNNQQTRDSHNMNVRIIVFIIHLITFGF